MTIKDFKIIFRMIFGVIMVVFFNLLIFLKWEMALQKRASGQ